MDRFLSIYLNDQLAMGVLWRELARRSAKNNRGTAVGDALADVARDIAEDVETFRDIMRRLHVRADSLKTSLAMAMERLARFKPNGALARYSPLSRFLEIDVLIMGIDGKKQLWITLRDAAGLGTRLPEIDFDRLVDRARHQRAMLEPFHTRTGSEALGDGGTSRREYHEEE